MMRGFRPRPPKRSNNFKGKKFEDEKYFSDEDEFDNLFYSEREKVYVKKSPNNVHYKNPRKNIPSKLTQRPREPQPHPQIRHKSNREQVSKNDEDVIKVYKSKNEQENQEGTKIKKKLPLILTKELTQIGISNVFKGTIPHPPSKKEPVGSCHLKNVVSLHLQKKGLQQIMPDAFKSFISLAHLYLYDNNITEMVGFSCIPQLESLYLSHNRIKRIENLDNCFNLRQLYLGHNEIEVIEGLENLAMLVELHIECQKLPSEQSLIFCPNSMETISRKLKVLNASGNQLDNIEDLSCLDVLDTLNLSRNKITDLDHVSQVLRGLRHLRVLDLRDNKIVKHSKYKEKIIGFCGGIEVFDEKDVNETQKKTFQRICAMKAVRNRNQQQRAANAMRNNNNYYYQSYHQSPSVHPFSGAFHHQQLHPEQLIQQSGGLTMAAMVIPIPMPIDLPENNFVFSTPISMSPTPDSASAIRFIASSTPGDVAFLDEHSDVEIAIQNEVDEFYSARSQPQDGEESETEMSEMAKIIFRLSNLSPSNENMVGGDIAGVGKSSSRSADQMTHSQYWAKNSSSRSGQGDRYYSTFKESRPLSPLEVDVPTGSSTKSGSIQNKSTSLSGLSVGRRSAPTTTRRPMTRKLGVLPTRNSVVGAGRTLSPLEELPTPDSTVRDPHEGRNNDSNNFNWSSSSVQSMQPSACSLPPLSRRTTGMETLEMMPSARQCRQMKSSKRLVL